MALKVEASVLTCIYKQFLSVNKHTWLMSFSFSPVLLQSILCWGSLDLSTTVWVVTSANPIKRPHPAVLITNMEPPLFIILLKIVRIRPQPAMIVPFQVNPFALELHQKWWKPDGYLSQIKSALMCEGNAFDSDGNQHETQIDIMYTDIMTCQSIKVHHIAQWKPCTHVIHSFEPFYEN